MKYIIVYYDLLQGIEPLSDAERGRLLTAMLQYASTGITPELSGGEKFLFPTIRLQIDRDKRKDTSGANHWNWKDGKTPENQRQRNSVEYKEWRESVFQRDGYRCQICHKIGGRLNAHHISPFSTDREKRFSVDNGITLCEKCHRRLHKKEKT